MKKYFATLGIAFGLLVAYLEFGPRSYPGIQVPRTRVTNRSDG